MHYDLYHFLVFSEEEEIAIERPERFERILSRSITTFLTTAAKAAGFTSTRCSAS